MEYFTFVYQARNYSAAARMIPMSPQGLAKSIHSLESELGVSLFIDVNGALTPTPYADTFLKYVNTWEQNHLMLKEEFDKIRAKEHHEIRLGTSLGIIGFIGTDFITTFEKKHPEISIVYNELNDTYCEEGLLRGTYDFAFTLAPYKKEFVTKELYATQVYLWINLKKSKSLSDKLSIEDLRDKSIAMPGKDFRIYETIMELCRSKGITLHEVYASNEIFWLYEYASQGKGFAFTLPHLMDLSVFAHNEDVTALPLDGVCWRFGISYVSSRQLLPHEKLFFEHLDGVPSGIES